MKEYKFNLEINYSQRRKSIALQVKENRLKVLAPKGIADLEIERIIDKNMDWILRRFAKNTQTPKIIKNYINGEKWRILNRDYFLQITLGTKTQVALKEAEKHLTISLAKADFFSKKSSQIVKSQLMLWIDNTLLELFEEYAHKYAKKLGVKFNKISIKDYKSMWGLCRAGDLFFNRRLIFAPKWILEYLAVHEVCHLKHPHHQKSFWLEVESFYPQYKAAKQWLKLKGEELIKLEF